MKLAPRFFDLYSIVQRTGLVAYKLDLPSGCKINSVFHVSQLKRQVGPPVTVSAQLPTFTDDGVLSAEPESVIEFRWTKIGSSFV